MVYSETRLTQPRTTRKLKRLSFMAPACVMIICWAYLNILVISGTDKLWLVPPNYLFCAWMCLHSWVTSLTFSFLCT